MIRENILPKRKEPELDPKEQFKRFQETAKELGVDRNEKEVERDFKRLASSPRAKQREKRD